MQMKQARTETKSAGQIVENRKKNCRNDRLAEFGISQSPRDLRVEHAKCVYTLSPFCQFDLFICR